MLYTPEYKKILEQEHARDRQWGPGPWTKAAKVVKAAEKENALTILDYGCGKGGFKKYMNDHYPAYTVFEYDPGIPGKDQTPDPAEMVVCFDVLEHVEPQCVDAMVDELKRLTLKLIMIEICSHPAGKILLDGRNAHLVQEHGDWWVEKFSKYFEFVAKHSVPGGLFAIMKPLK